MSVLLHVSDPHFGTEQPPVVDALLALARDRRPDLLVLSGDITQRAKAAQFAAARRVVDAIGAAQTLVVPGNHDIPLYDVFARALRPYAGFLAAFGPRTEPVVQTDAFLAVGLNTTRPRRHKDGEVSPAQTARVARELAGAQRTQLRVVVTHQPTEVYRAEDVHDRLHGGLAAAQAWARAGADLVLGGHIHLPYVLNLQSGAAPTPRPLWCLQAGTAVSSRVRHGTQNSVNLVHWHAPAVDAPRTCRFERCDYDPAARRFSTVESFTLALGD